MELLPLIPSFLDQCELDNQIMKLVTEMRASAKSSKSKRPPH
jgi:hypothetical protein